MSRKLGHSRRSYNEARPLGFAQPATHREQVSKILILFLFIQSISNDQKWNEMLIQTEEKKYYSLAPYFKWEKLSARDEMNPKRLPKWSVLELTKK